MGRGARLGGVSKEDWTISFTEDYQRGPWGQCDKSGIIEPPHWGIDMFHFGGGQQGRSLGGLAFHKRGSTKQA